MEYTDDTQMIERIASNKVNNSIQFYVNSIANDFTQQIEEIEG